MPMFSSINRTTDQFFTALGPNLVNWDYTPGTIPTLTPVNTTNWPDGFKLSFFNTSAGRFETTDGVSADYHASHGHTNRQYFLDDEDTFALVSTTTTPGNNDFRLLLASKFDGTPGTTLTAPGTVVLGSTTWDGTVQHGFVHDAGVPSTGVFHSIATNTYAYQFTARSYAPTGPSTAIDGSKLLQRVALLDPATRQYIGLCTRIFQDPAISATLPGTPAGVEDKTYVTSDGTQQRLVRIWRLVVGSRGGLNPFDLYIPFDGVVSTL